MAERVNGASSSQQNLTGGLQFYILYCTSPGAYTDSNPNPPENEQEARGINILVTEDLDDQSQRNFEITLQSIALRAMPVIMNDPVAVLNLEEEGAPSLSSEGYIYKFAAERTDQFFNYSVNGTAGEVGLLIDELDGVFIDSGVRITTVDGSISGVNKNMEFVRVDEI